MSISRAKELNYPNNFSRKLWIYGTASFIFWSFPLRAFLQSIFLFQLNEHNTRWSKYDRDSLCINKPVTVPVIFEPPSTLNTYIYHQLPPKCFGVCYTIFRETIDLLPQVLYALCNVVTEVVLQSIIYILFLKFTTFSILWNNQQRPPAGNIVGALYHKL